MNDLTLQYAAAQAAQYTAKDLRTAIEAYHSIIIAHPASVEAGYSRTQIQGIASRIISKDALLEVQMRLLLAELGNERDSGIPDVAHGEAEA